MGNLHEWGCRAWVRNEASAKLGGRVDEGIWVGYDDKSNGSRIYWPDQRTITVERNIYFNNPPVRSDHLEGEEEVLVEPVRANPQNENPPKSPAIPIQNTQARTTHITPTPDENQPRERRIRSVSRRVQDIIDGRGTSSLRRTDPIIPRGVQLPSIPTIVEATQFEGEGTSNQMLALEEDLTNMDGELAMAAEVAEAEALEPTSFTDAQRRPDKVDWQRAMEEEFTTLTDMGTWKLE